MAFVDLNTIHNPAPGLTIPAAWGDGVRDNFVDLNARTDYLQGAVATLQSTSSTSYTDLTTAGPAVTVVTGTKALVIISCTVGAGTNDADAFMSWAVSGATTISASDVWAIRSGNAQWTSMSRAYLHAGLTAGSNIFTAKYKVLSSTGSWLDRHITVIPVGKLS